MKIYKKNSKRIVSIVLSIAMLSSIVSPVFADYKSNAVAVEKATSNLFKKFLVMVGIAKKSLPTVNVEIGKTEKGKTVAMQIVGKTFAIAKFLSKGAISGVNLLVVKPVVGVTKFVAKNTFDSTKYVAKTVFDSYLNTLGKVGAIGTIVVGVAGLGALLVYLGYNKLKPAFSGSGNNSNVPVDDAAKVAAPDKTIKNYLADIFISKGIDKVFSTIKEKFVDIKNKALNAFGKNKKEEKLGENKLIN